LSDQVGIAPDVERFQTGVVTALDSGEIAETVLRLRRAPERLRKMGALAARTVRQLYDGDRAAHLMLQAFRDILQGSRSPECQWRPAGAAAVRAEEATVGPQGIA